MVSIKFQGSKNRRNRQSVLGPQFCLQNWDLCYHNMDGTKTSQSGAQGQSNEPNIIFWGCGKNIPWIERQHEKSVSSFEQKWQAASLFHGIFDWDDDAKKPCCFCCLDFVGCFVLDIWNDGTSCPSHRLTQRLRIITQCREKGGSRVGAAKEQRKHQRITGCSQNCRWR